MAYLIIILNAVALALFIFYSPHNVTRIITASGTVLLLIITFIIPKLTRYTTINVLPVLFWICIGSWALIQSWIPALVDIILLGAFTVARRKLIVSVSQEGISYPSFPVRNYDWRSFQNVILKDGLLTLDFNNNKIVQAPISASEAVNERLFNDYCRGYLTNH